MHGDDECDVVVKMLRDSLELPAVCAAGSLGSGVGVPLSYVTDRGLGWERVEEAAQELGCGAVAAYVLGAARSPVGNFHDVAHVDAEAVAPPQQDPACFAPGPLGCGISDGLPAGRFDHDLTPSRSHRCPCTIGGPSGWPIRTSVTVGGYRQRPDSRSAASPAARAAAAAQAHGGVGDTGSPHPPSRSSKLGPPGASGGSCCSPSTQREAVYPCDAAGSLQTDRDRGLVENPARGENQSRGRPVAGRIEHEVVVGEEVFGVAHRGEFLVPGRDGVLRDDSEFDQMPLDGFDLGLADVSAGGHMAYAVARPHTIMIDQGEAADT